MFANTTTATTTDADASYGSGYGGGASALLDAETASSDGMREGESAATATTDTVANIEGTNG